MTWVLPELTLPTTAQDTHVCLTLAVPPRTGSAACQNWVLSENLALVTQKHAEVLGWVRVVDRAWDPFGGGHHRLGVP